MNYKSLLPLILLFFIIGLKAKAQSIEKGFEDLYKYNYFDAKTIFEKRLKKDSSIAAYGLAKIYYQEKTPLFNIYQATNFISVSYSTFLKYSEKEKKKLQSKYFFNENTIDSLRQEIADIKFSLLEEELNIDSIKLFTKNFSWYLQIKKANALLSKLEFEKAIKVNNIEIWTAFYNKDNNYKYHDIAKHHIDSILFYNAKQGRNIDQLTTFTKNNIDNEFLDSAYYLIYKYSINNSNNYEDYHVFIVKNKENPYIKDAWKKMAHNYFKTYKQSEIEYFINTYPNSLIKDDLKRLLNISNMNLYPFMKNGLWGFINDQSEIVIEAKYEEVSKFNNGKAKIKLNNKYGFINLLNEIIIKPQYSDATNFHEKYAIVENKNQFYLIDINNEKLVTPLLKDSYWVNKKFAIIESSQGYQYFNCSTGKVNNFIYDDISSLDYDFMIAKKNNLATLISINGIITDSVQNFEKIINHQYYLTIENNIKKVHNIITDSTLMIEYDFISQSYNDRILVIKNEKIAYLNDSLKRVIPFVYPYKNYIKKPEFKNKYVMILYKNKWGAMNTNGEKVLPSMFENLKYENNVFVGKKDGKWGVVNQETINWYIKPTYPFISVIDSSTFVTTVENKLGVIDINENKILPFQYQDITSINNLILLKKEGKYDVYDYKNKITLSSNNIKYFIEDKVLYVYNKENEMMIINTITNKIIYNSLQN